MFTTFSEFFCRLKRPWQRSRRGFASVAGILVIVWFASESGWIRALDNAVFDALSTNDPSTSTMASPVILVSAELRAHHFGDNYWLELLNRLRAGSPDRIGFMMLPEGASSAFYEQAGAASDVIFGRTVVTSKKDMGYEGLQHLPENAMAADLTFGVLGPPNQSAGVVRSVSTSHKVNGQIWSSFAWRTAFGADAVSDSMRNTLLIDFSRGTRGLTTVSADRILADAFEVSQLKGKVVIVGYVDDVYIPLVSTPLSDMTTTLTLQGLAIESLIFHRAITPLGSQWVFPLLLVAGFVLFPIFIRLRLIVGIGLGGAILALIYFVAAVTFSELRFWVEVGPLLLCVVMIFMFATFMAAVSKDDAVAGMSAAILRRLSALKLPVSYVKSPDHWQHIVDLIDARLDVTKLIILELGVGTRRLTEVAAFNCTYDEIDERRRNPDRIPYSLATEKPTPIRLASPFFKSTAPREEEYLVALRFNDELLGFWAFAIAREKVVQVPMFSMLICDYAKEIGQLMGMRREATMRANQSWFHRWFQHDPPDLAHHQARVEMGVLGSRLKMLEDVLALMNTAIGVFDLFGRYVAGSDKLEAVLGEAGMPLSELSLVGILTALGGISHDDVKRALRYVVHQQGSISVVTSIKGQSSSTLTLHIRPLQCDPDENLGEGDPAPFKLRGIIVELVDVTQLRRIYELKESLVEKINKQLGSSLKGVKYAASVMGNKGVPEIHRSRLLSLTGKRLGDAVAVLEEAQRYLQLNLHGARLECFPVAIKPILQRSLDQGIQGVARRGVNVRVDLDGLENELGFADPQTLQDLFTLILNYLLSSAEPDTVIDVYLKQDELSVLKRHEIVLWFSAFSAKETEASLRRRLLEDNSDSEDEYFHLRNAMRITQNWGGALSIDLEGDRHLVVRLVLKGFL